MANLSFDSRFSFPDASTDQYQRWVSYFVLILPVYFAYQQGAILTINQPYPTSMGTRQVETATGSGTATSNGVVAVVLTSKGMDFSPLTINVPVFSGETASQWMDRVRAYFQTTPQVQMYFSVSGSGSQMILKRRSPFASNDTTLNVSIGGTGTTATGIASSPTSTNTTAGSEFSYMTQISFYEANISVTASQVGTSVLLNTSVTGRLEPV
jgi:phage tail sheath gpL-like